MAHRNPIVAIASPILPPLANPSSSQLVPIEKAWPGPWANPRGRSKPKGGNNFGRNVYASERVMAKPRIPWVRYEEIMARPVFTLSLR